MKRSLVLRPTALCVISDQTIGNFRNTLSAKLWEGFGTFEVVQKGRLIRVGAQQSFTVGETFSVQFIDLIGS